MSGKILILQLWLKMIWAKQIVRFLKAHCLKNESMYEVHILYVNKQS